MSDLAGYDLLRSGDYVNAIDIFNRTIMSKDSDDLMVLKKLLSTIYRGRCYFELEMYDKAISDYCTFKNDPLSKQRSFKVKGVDPGRIPYNIIDEFERIDYNLGKAYFFSEEYEKAFKYFNDFIENNTNNNEIKKVYLFDSWKFKGLSALLMLNYSEAEKALDNALKNGNSKLTDKDYQADIDIIKESLYLIRLHKDFTKGRDLQEKKNYSDAINTYNSILEVISSNQSNRRKTIIDAFFINHIFETYRDTLMNKGICLKNTKNYDYAIETLEALIDYVPDQNYAVSLYTEIARCYYDNDMPERALEYWKKVEECKKNIIDTSYDTISQIKFQQKLAEFENDIRNKKYNEALDVADSILQENDTLSCWRDILKGRAYFKLGKYEETSKCLRPHVDADWVDIRINNDVARVMAYTYAGGADYKKNSYAIALKYLKKCAEIDSYKYIATWVFMGECYIELRDYEKAGEAFKEAADVWKENDDYTREYIESRIQFIAEQKNIPNSIIINGNNNPVNIGGGHQVVNIGGHQNINNGGQQVIGDGIINRSSAGNVPFDNVGPQIIGDGIINRSNAGNVTPQDDTEICLCPNCGTKVSSGDLFCGMCGEKLK